MAFIVFVFTITQIIGYGYIFGGLAFLLGETVSILVNLLQFLLIILCSIFTPFSALPDVVTSISRWIPLSYNIDLFRSAALGYPGNFPELQPVTTEFIIVIVAGLLVPVAGFWFFRACEQSARYNGKLSDY